MTSSTQLALKEAVAQNAEAVEQIKGASNELDVVHAVLSTHVVSPQASTDVLAAVERTDEIGQQLAETAEALQRTTGLLRQAEASDSNPS
ncbi:hypothetical protein [Acidovorax sp. FG27]|uniref:hypothetical protein n=1 Tax=Acidovorax sp. FG27 TaxID=3133652 RepID=UPI0030E79F5E